MQSYLVVGSLASSLPHYLHDRSSVHFGLNVEPERVSISLYQRLSPHEYFTSLEARRRRTRPVSQHFSPATEEGTHSGATRASKARNLYSISALLSEPFRNESIARWHSPLASVRTRLKYLQVQGRNLEHFAITVRRVSGKKKSTQRPTCSSSADKVAAMVPPSALGSPFFHRDETFSWSGKPRRCVRPLWTD